MSHKRFRPVARSPKCFVPQMACQLSPTRTSNWETSDEQWWWRWWCQ